MTKEEFQEINETMRPYVWNRIVQGFHSRDDIADLSAEEFGNDYPDVDTEVVEQVAEQLTRTLIQFRRNEQASWPETTDCDRLDAAFEELTQKGIVARQNFSCCGNCGSAEIWGEIHDEQDDGIDVRGYAFYHMQDTDSAVEGYGLYLNYSAVEENEEAGLQIGREIVATLRRHLLSVEWNGNFNTRIHVGLDWKCRWVDEEMLK